MHRHGAPWSTSKLLNWGLRMTHRPATLRLATSRSDIRALRYTLDANEEKVKRVLSHSKRTPPGTQDTSKPAKTRTYDAPALTAPSSAPAAAAAAVAAAVILPHSASAQPSPVHTPLDLTWGEPNELLAGILAHADAKQQAAEATAAAEAAAQADAGSPLAKLHEGSQQLAGVVQERVNALLAGMDPPADQAWWQSQRLGSLQQIPQQNIPSQQSLTELLHTSLAAPAATASHLLASVQQLSDSLASSLDKTWPLPLPAAQLATYVAAVLGVALLLHTHRDDGDARTSKPKSGTVSSQAGSAAGEATGSSNWGIPSGPSTSSKQGTSAPRGNTTPPVMRSTTPASKQPPTVAAANSGSPAFQGGEAASVRRVAAPPTHSKPQHGPSSAPALNPVQEAWQHYRTTLPEYREAATPKAAAATASTPAHSPSPVQSLGWWRRDAGTTTATSTTTSTTSTSNISSTLTTASQLVSTLHPQAGDHIHQGTSGPEARRQALKEKLQLISLALGRLMSMVPGGDPARLHADGLLHELESIAPTSAPLRTGAHSDAPHGGSVLGVWELVYATNDHQAHRTSVPDTSNTSSQVQATGPSKGPTAVWPSSAVEQFTQQHRVSHTGSSPAHRSETKGNAWSTGKPTATVATTGARSSSPQATASSSAAPDQSNQTSSRASRVNVTLSQDLNNGYEKSDLVSTVLHLAALLPGFGLERVEQQLWEDVVGSGVMRVTNSATFSLGPLGVWSVSASGGWRDTGDGHCAQGWFDSLALQPLRLLGIDTTSLPRVAVALPDSMRAMSTWDTTYLDRSMRISRGEAGTVFLFQRVAPDNVAAVERGWADRGLLGV